MQFLNRDGTLNLSGQVTDAMDCGSAANSWLALMRSNIDELLGCVRFFTATVLHQTDTAVRKQQVGNEEL